LNDKTNNPMNITEITSPRLLLRAFSDEDVQPLFQLLNNHKVHEFMPTQTPPSEDKVRDWVAKHQSHWNECGYGWWALELKASAELMGWGGLGYLDETQEIEVLYLLGEQFWGMGYATEAAQASTAFAFERMKFDQLVGIVHPQNAASRRVLEKIGMSYVETKVYFGMDCNKYEITREMFMAKSPP
jgi:ribosomal-protein-alanine N-acetyltransferase